jgi:hypothetical protein
MQTPYATTPRSPRANKQLVFQPALYPAQAFQPNFAFPYELSYIPEVTEEEALAALAEVEATYQFLHPDVFLQLCNEAISMLPSHVPIAGSNIFY